VRAVAAALAAGALILGSALPAHAAPVVSEVAGGELISSLVEYQGLLYLGSEAGLQSYDGTTFTVIPGAPESPRNFVEYLGDLWMIGGDVTTPGDAVLWRFDGTTFTSIYPASGQPFVSGGLLYHVGLDPVLGERHLVWQDGVATVFPPPGDPADVSEVAAGPNGEIVLTAGATRSLLVFDPVATTFTPVAGSPVNVDQLSTVGGALVFDGQVTAGDPDTAYSWDGTTVTSLGAAEDPICFVADGGALYYGADDGATRLFSAIPGVAASEAVVSPDVPMGCPRYVATDGTFYLQAQGTGGNPTLHTWDGATLTELDSVGDFPRGLTEYGGKIYFTAQPISETPALFVLEDVTPTPAAPTLPDTGGQVSWWLLAVAALLLAGGAGILVAEGSRRRA
jgi:LPXTG-motif cell wall-anchored protein